MTQHPAFDDFVDTIAALRAPDGCPWDREQTHESIARNMIEEAYEAVDAIEANNIAHLREELGDVLLQVVLQSQIASDQGNFTIDDVCQEVNEKIVRRHPHVFGDRKAAGKSASEVLELWDEIKLEELKNTNNNAAQNPATVASAVDATSTPSEASAVDAATAPCASTPTTNASTPSASLVTTAASAAIPVTKTFPFQDISSKRTGLLEAVPNSFPALMQAQKISRKVVSVGFEWETLEQVWDQVYAEIEELKEAYAQSPKDAKGKVEQGSPAELEMGDVLFTLTNVSRKMGIDAESALRASNKKFRNRWAFIEGAAWAQGKDVENLSLDEMEKLWVEAKKHERGA